MKQDTQINKICPTVFTMNYGTRHLQRYPSASRAVGADCSTQGHMALAGDLNSEVSLGQSSPVPWWIADLNYLTPLWSLPNFLIELYLAWHSFVNSFKV